MKNLNAEVRREEMEEAYSFDRIMHEFAGMRWIGLEIDVVSIDPQVNNARMRKAKKQETVGNSYCAFREALCPRDESTGLMRKKLLGSDSRMAKGGHLLSENQ